MNHSETKKLIATTGAPSQNVYAERVLLLNEAGVPISTKSEAELNSQYVGATVTDGRAVIQQPDYPVDVATKGGYAALKILGYTGSTANKAPLQLYSAKSSAAGEDVLFSVDYAGNGFPGPITIIKTDGGIETGAYLKVSGHAKNAGSSAGYKEATYKRTMATIWTDTPGATEIVSCSHNDNTLSNTEFLSAHNTWQKLINTHLPGRYTIHLTQNPTKSPVEQPNIDEQAKQRLRLIS